MSAWSGASRQALLDFALVSFAYLASGFLTFQVIYPLQSWAFGPLPNSISLLHLPHTVRILAAYFLGWRSVLYLFPVSIISVYLTHGEAQDMVTLLLLASLISAVGYLGFLTACALKKALFADLPAQKDWILLLIAGAVASLLNAAGHAAIIPAGGIFEVGYLIGDMGGLFFTLIALILVFRTFDTKS